MKKVALLLILVVIFLSSCRKIDNVTPDQTIKPTKDLIAQPSFDWKTSKIITLNVIGMVEINPSISGTLYVKSSNGEIIYYKDLLLMNTNYTLNFAVPTTETKVILVYGSKTVTIDLLSNTITFDYIIQ